MLEAYDKNRWKVPNSDDDSPEPIVFAKDSIKKQIEKKSLKQLVDATKLRGVEFVGGMPDLHVGYGVPVGSVMVMDANDGLISAGAVGMDINCGMRLMSSNIDSNNIDQSRIKSLARQISKIIPLGIGTTSPHQEKLSDHIESILLNGVESLKDLGYARQDDIESIQDGGHFPGANLDAITEDAWDRLDQLSTLGGGNHFIEIDVIDEVFNEEVGEIYGLKKDMLSVMIHTGSRGFGHQICTDYSSRMLNVKDKHNLDFPTKELASAPIDSKTGQNYIQSMAAAANIAYSNRQMIGYDIRKVFSNLLGNGSANLETVYDITHNLARSETINGQEVYTHRKGAIRALPPGHPDNPERFNSVGHPIIVPGNMATGSYVLRAKPKVVESCFTVNHGAGRTMSRRQAKDSFTTEVFRQSMEDIVLLGTAHDKLLDESPPAYKKLDPVVDSLADIGLVEKIARLKPRAVIKGG